MMSGYEVGAGGYQLTEQHTWIAQFGVSYALGVNGIGVDLRKPVIGFNTGAGGLRTHGHAGRLLELRPEQRPQSRVLQALWPTPRFGPGGT